MLYFIGGIYELTLSGRKREGERGRMGEGVRKTGKYGIWDLRIQGLKLS
jgi:hypothetical protein